MPLLLELICKLQHFLNRPDQKRCSYACLQEFWFMSQLNLNEEGSKPQKFSCLPSPTFESKNQLAFQVPKEKLKQLHILISFELRQIDTIAM